MATRNKEEAFRVVTTNNYAYTTEDIIAIVDAIKDIEQRQKAEESNG